MSEPIQRWWGVYDLERKSWARKADGEIYHYPLPGFAQAHLDNLISDMAHVVDGRGHPVAQGRFVVREMVYDGEV